MTHPVLVVDDERDLRVTYERLLRRQGYQVIQADSRHAGLALIRAHPLSLVIADLRLADGDGLDVVVAARSAASPAPAIVVTASPTWENRRASVAAGASGFLAKPFAAADFSAIVRQVLGDRREI
jgi:two-component system response regulator RegA